MRFQPVETSAVSVWRWETVFAALIILVFCGVPLFSSRIPTGIALAASIVLSLLLATWALWYPHARFRHLGWHLDASGLTIQSGIYWRSQSTVARIRIQHTDVSQGPLQRHYDIATLKLYTAGSHFSKIELPGLSHATAIQLRDELQSAGKSTDQSTRHEDAI